MWYSFHYQMSTVRKHCTMTGKCAEKRVWHGDCMGIRLYIYRQCFDTMAMLFSVSKLQIGSVYVITFFSRILFFLFFFLFVAFAQQTANPSKKKIQFTLYMYYVYILIHTANFPSTARMTEAHCEKLKT